MAYRWIKLYGEIRHDTKLSDFSNDWFGILIKLFLIADEIGKDGLIPGRASQGGYSRQDLATELKTTPDNLNAVLLRLRRGGNMASILKTFPNGDIFITNYKKRQAKPPSAEAEAVAERVKKYRENVTTLKRDGNEEITTPRKITERLQKDIKKEDPPIVPPKGGHTLTKIKESKDTWERVLSDLKLHLNKTNYDTWLIGTFALGYHGDVLVVHVPSTFVIDWLSKRLRSKIDSAMINILGRKVEVEYRTDACS